MNVGKAFTYVFDDPQWVMKVLFASLFALLSMFLIGIPFLLGYTVQVVRNVHRGDPNPLPEWTDFGGLFTEGLKLLAVYFVYALPIFVLYCCAFAIQIGAAAVSDNRSGGGIAAVGGIVGLLFQCVLWIYALVFSVLRPAISIQFAKTGNINECLRVGEIIAIPRRVPGPYVITFLLWYVASMVGQLGFIALCVGVFVTMAYAYLVGANLDGQLWQQVDAAPAAA